jgi:hypothetical protein
MADESNAPAAADATQQVEEPTRPADDIAQPAVAEAKPAEGGIIATSGVAEGKCHRLQLTLQKLMWAFNQFPRPTMLRTSLLQKTKTLPTRSPRLRPLVMTQVSWHQAMLHEQPCL